MAKKIKLIDLTQLKKSHHLFMQENAHIITEAKQQLKNYQEFANNIGYTPEVQQKLQDVLLATGQQNEVTEAISQEKTKLEQAVKEDIKKYKKILKLKNNLLNSTN
jgi:translation initiation factor 2 beta subunit (eIF-2beta)/eIF-5